MNDIIQLVNKVIRDKGINITLSTEDLNSPLRQLKIDSLAAMTIIVDIEEKLGIMIPDEKLSQLKTLKDLIDIIIEQQEKVAKK